MKWFHFGVLVGCGILENGVNHVRSAEGLKNCFSFIFTVLYFVLKKLDKLDPRCRVQVSFLFSDRGLPDGYRHMNGYGSHTFKLVNADGDRVYCKFHYKVCWPGSFSLLVRNGTFIDATIGKLIKMIFFFYLKTDQGIKNLSVEEAEHLASTNPDYAIGDLFNAIANGNYPSWTFYIQVMTFEQAEKFQFNPFDLTKVMQNSELRAGLFWSFS